LLTFEQICAADAKPRNVTAGITAPEALAFEGTGCEIGLGGGILFRASGSEFSAAPLVIQGRPLIQVSASDEHLFIDLLLMEDATNALLHINKNEMVIGTGHWDVEFVGQTLTLRNAPRQITFDIEFTPPSTVTVTRGFFFWNGSAIRVTPEGVRLINSGNQLRDIRFDASFFVGVAVDGTIPGRGTMLDIGGPGIPFQNLTEAIALEPTVSRIYEEVAREAEGKMKAGEFMRIDRVAMERIEHAVNDFRKDKA
jgi:hypothetical protein